MTTKNNFRQGPAKKCEPCYIYSMLNVRNILTDHRYIDKRNDLEHRLTTGETDALCSFFATCKENEDYDEDYLHQVADNTIKKRLHIL